MRSVSNASIIQMLEGRPRVALFIRHAERYSMQSVFESDRIGLTENGKVDAFQLGSTVPEYPYYRFFHSPALRCRQTAEEMAKAIEARGGRVSLIEEDDTLCSPYVKDERCLEVADRMGDRFMREWLDGRVDPNWINDKVTSTVQIIGPVLERLGQGGEHLDVHVSHDWDIMLTREVILGLRHESEGWLPYLDGIAFSPNGYGYEAGYHGKRASFIFNDGGILKN